MKRRKKSGGERKSREGERKSPCIDTRTEYTIRRYFYGRRKTGKGRRGESCASQCSEGKNTLHSQRQERKVKQIRGVPAREAEKYSL